MSDDLLERATSALREETSAPELKSGLTRARLLDSAAKQRARRFKLRFVVPFVITLGAGSALAHVTQQYFPEVWNALVPAALERAVPERPEHETARRAKKKQAPEAATAPVVEAPSVQPAPTPAPEIAHAAEPAPAPAPPDARTHGDAKRTKPATTPAFAPAPAPIEAAAEPAPSVGGDGAPAPAALAPATTAKPESAELALFRRALALHDGKNAAAVAAWDDFLRVAPASPLAPEARYNRALGLVRAGRAREAKAALAPFARGEHGGYRQREAAELLEALEHRDGGTAP